MCDERETRIRHDSPRGRNMSLHRGRTASSWLMCRGPHFDAGILLAVRGESTAGSGRCSSRRRALMFDRHSSSTSTNAYRPLRAARVNHLPALGDFHHAPCDQTAGSHARRLYQGAPFGTADRLRRLRRTYRCVACTLVEQCEYRGFERFVFGCGACTTTSVGAVLHLLPVARPL